MVQSLYNLGVESLSRPLNYVFYFKFVLLVMKNVD